MRMMDDSLLPGPVRARVAGPLGRRLYYLPEVDSTNDFALLLAHEGEPEGTLVLTDYQRRGRGRKGRVWHSSPGKDLLFSLILRPGISRREMLSIPLLGSLAVSIALGDLLEVPLQVKWPNDVQIGGRKVCGILAEGSSARGGLEFVVLGVGINVNSSSDDFPPSLRTEATSCLIASGRRMGRVEVLARVMATMGESYRRLRREGFRPFVDSYLERLSVMGKTVSFRRAGVRVRGRVLGIAEDGGLVVAVRGEGKTILYSEEIDR